jgi:predicted GNAT family acetyltransferase
MELRFFDDPADFLAYVMPMPGAAVHAVSRELLDHGERPCLFTDQANPTSNKIYEAVGYRGLVDMANLRVE